MLHRQNNIKHLIKINKNPLLLSIGLGVVFVILYIVLFVIPTKVYFSYGGETCIDRLVLLPGIYRQDATDKIVVKSREEIRVSNFAWLSTKQCVEPIRDLSSGTESLQYSPFGTSIFAYNYQVIIPDKPKLDLSVLNKPVATTKTLHIPISSADDTSTYEMRIDSRNLLCVSAKKEILCPLQILNLRQGEIFEVEVTRSFKEQESQKVYIGKVATLSATKVADSSIKPGEVVYNKPSAIVIDFDKQIIKAAVDLVRVQGESRSKVDVSQSLSSNTVTVSLPAGTELARDADYEATVNGVLATDGSSLIEPYMIKFHVSGGPKVVGVNIGKTGVGINETIVLSFDQELSSGQDIGKYVSLAGGGYSVIRDGSRVKISLKSLSKCTDFTISVAPGISSAYDVVSSDRWSFSARTVCYSISTIGYSTKGKPINAYYFGSGGSIVLFVGAIHGNEASSSYILKDWIAYLDNNAKNIPSNRQIVVVPTINPDGLASGSRMNANGVNLNRNFSTADWKKDIKDTGGTVINGGGSTPMSESETKALASLTTQLRPRLVLSYHAVGSVTIGNDRGDSRALAGSYASMVGYSNATGNSSEVFSYEISGTYDDWVAETLNAPSIVVELGSYTYRNFDNHRSAMWTMATS